MTKNCVFCSSAKNAALRNKCKDWLSQNQDNVFDWNDMSVIINVAI